MRKNLSVANALPLLVASHGCSTWMEVLSTYQTTCEMLTGIYQPTTEELNRGLSKMENSWGTSLFYYGIIKEKCGHHKPPTRIVSTALERFKRCGNFYAIKQIMENDVDITTNEGARSALMYASFTGMWEHAIKLYENNKQMQQSMSNTRTLIHILSMNGRWKEAIELLYRRSPPKLNSITIRPILRSLGLAGEIKKMLRLVAASLAQGYEMDYNMFSVLIRPLQKGGESNALLETALNLGIFSLSREIHLRYISTYAGLIDCLYSLDPYNQYTLNDIVNDISYRMQPRKILLRSSHKNGKKFRLFTSNDIFRTYRRYIMPLSSIYVKLLSLNNFYTRPVSEIVEEAFKHGDIIIVLDTNFLVQCTSKNLPLSHFNASIRKQYPHLGEKTIQRVIIPFTTIREIHKLIWSPETQLKRAVRSLLWSRVISFLKQPSVTVISLGSEFPCISFSVIPRLAYSRLNEPASENDPDLRILNTCLAIQYAFRQQSVASLQRISQTSEGALLFSFLKYHVRRHRREVKGIACDKLLLCTLDKRLSAAADELGIQAFPQFNMTEQIVPQTET